MAQERARRRLAAILAADIVGYSRLMRADEAGTLAQLKALRKDVLLPKLDEYAGRVVKTTGDGILIEFPSAVDAVECAVDLQGAMARRNVEVPESRRMEIRIGINVGDIVVEDDDLFGDGINVAARLEGLAEPGGICLSGSAYEQVQQQLDLAFEDLGEQTVKNIDQPIRVYRTGVAVESTPSERLPEETRPPLALPDKPSIVVLPFDNMSGDPEQDYLADGIAEAITTALSHIRSFFVIARNSAFTYKGKANSIPEVGRQLGVAYVLEGSVQRGGERVRITVQLAETDGGANIWAERYDGKIDDVFELQDRITEQVAGALQPSIRISEIDRSRRKRPGSLGAYDYAMRAMPHVWALEQDESATALGLLDRALEVDPDYPLALSLAAWCHGQRSVYNWAEDITESRAEALRLAKKAVELSGDDSLLLAVLGAVHTIVRNHGTAKVLLERAVTLDPNAAWAWSRLGWLENYSNHPEPAIEHFEHALRLSPLDPMNFNNFVGMATAHDIMQDYDKAAELYRRALQERPHLRWIDRQLAACLSGAGRMDEAQEVFARMMEAYPGLTVSMIRQAMVFSSPFMDRIVANLKKLGLPE